MLFCRPDEIDSAITSMNATFSRPGRQLTSGCKIELGLQLIRTAIEQCGVSAAERADLYAHALNELLSGGQEAAGYGPGVPELIPAAHAAEGLMAVH